MIGLSASWAAQTFNFIKLDLTQFFRDRLVVISTLLTSVSMLLAFGFGASDMKGFSNAGVNYFEYVFPGILAIGIMFSSTYTIGYAFLVDRQRRTIEDIVLSPISYMGFIVARVVGMLIKSALQFVFVIVISHFFFAVMIDSFAFLTLIFVLQCIFFASLGIIISTFTNEISFSGFVNIILIPLTYFCGVFFPVDGFGQAKDFISLLPLSIHVDLFRAGITGGGDLSHQVWLASAYAIVSITVALYVFKRLLQKG